MVALAVSGSASTTIAPERGTAVLRVKVSDEERRSATDRATRAHARLVADARGFVEAGAATRWSADQVVVRAEEEWDSETDRHNRVQVASGGLTVRFVDFGALAAWIGEVGEVTEVEVQGVEWSLTAERLGAAERQVRTEAVQDALARAAAYAAALGLGAPEVVALHEPGLRPVALTSGGSRQTFGWTAQAIRGSGRGDGEWTLDPQDVEVSAELSLECTAS